MVEVSSTNDQLDLMSNLASQSSKVKPRTTDDLPAEFDWRDRHKVTSVRDQSQCNACYAFAVTSAIESALAIRYDINVNINLTSTVNNGTNSTRNSSYNLSPVEMVNLKVVSTGNEHYVNLNLSVQQLIDCTFMRTNRSNSLNTSLVASSSQSAYRNNACQYGYIEDTFRYVAENGLLSEEVYPYAMQVSANSFSAKFCMLLFFKNMLFFAHKKCTFYD